MRYESKNQLQRVINIARQYLLQLRDIRVAGQIVFVIIVILVSWSGVKAINANYILQKQIALLQQQNTVQELKNSNQKLQNEYFNSRQYLELSARQNFGLADPGEKELMVPKSVALSYTVNEPKPVQVTQPAHLPLYKRNMLDWLDFYLHRPSPQD